MTLVHSDELTLATWKSEAPQGTVLNDVAEFTSDYAKPDWDVRMKRAPTVLSFPGYDLADRDLMLGIQAFGASRAFLYDRVIKEKLVKDHVGSEPVLLVVGADDQSVRAFRDRIPGIEGAADFYRITGKPSGALLLDAATGSEWNFQGCAISGKAKGQLSGADSHAQGLLVRLAQLQSEDDGLRQGIVLFDYCLEAARRITSSQ